MYNLSKKIALITGATGDIGEEIAKLFHSQGAFVILSGTRLEKLQEISNILSDRVAIIACNLSDSADIKLMIEKINNKYGSVDILVNNAGITKDNLALVMKEKDFDDVIQINLKAAFLLLKFTMKKMLKKRWGRIINIASVVATTGNPGQANYCASKAGIIGMTKAIALEMAKKNITINCISPGFIESNMTKKLNENQRQAILSAIPQGTIGEPIDIAHTALFLASEESRYITGQNIHVNGGLVMV